MRKVYYFITFLISLLFISCSFMPDDSLSYSIASKQKLSIYVSSSQTKLNFGSSSRTITPEALDADNLDFYLSGKNKSTSDPIETTLVDFAPCTDDSSTGLVTFYLAPGMYELTLSAVPKDTAYSSSSVVLQGNAYTDLRTTDNTVFFYLTSSNINGYGQFNLALYTLGWQVTDSMEVTAGIYKLDNDLVYIYRTELFNLIDYHYDSESDVPAEPVYNYNENNGYLAAGTYIFKITIKNNDTLFYYTDRITIEPNRTTKAKVAIPNIVTQAPDSPDYLIARYQKPESQTMINYPVEFCWCDNSKNESNFQLELLRLNDYFFDTYPEETAALTSVSSTKAAKDSAWANLKTYSSYQSKSNSIILDNAFYDDEDISKILEGSLSANKNYCLLNLSLGYSYFARICAVSAAGNSSYTYVDISNSNSKEYAATKSTGTFYNWSSDAKALNLYRIKYELNNGRFYDDDSSTDVTYNIPTADYCFQTTTGASILNPVNYIYNETSKKATLKANSATKGTFNYWRKNSLYGSIYDISENYTGSTNLTLYADFGETSENPYKLVGNTNIFVFGNSELSASDNMFQNQISLDSHNSCTISKASYPYAIFTLKNIFADITANTATSGIYDKVFDSVTFQLLEQGCTPYSLDTSTKQITLTGSTDTSVYEYIAIDLTNTTYFETGKTYNVIITATVGNQQYLTTIIFNLTD